MTTIRIYRRREGGYLVTESREENREPYVTVTKNIVAALFWGRVLGKIRTHRNSNWLFEWEVSDDTS